MKSRRKLCCVWWLMLGSQMDKTPLTEVIMYALDMNGSTWCFIFTITRFKAKKPEKVCGSHIAQQAMPNILLITVRCTPVHRTDIYQDRSQ